MAEHGLRILIAGLGFGICIGALVIDALADVPAPSSQRDVIAAYGPDAPPMLDFLLEVTDE